MAGGDVEDPQPFAVALEMGARLEDIVVATDAGPRRLNQAPRDLVVVD